jgi:hypothetical protein
MALWVVLCCVAERVEQGLGDLVVVARSLT